MSKLSNLEDLSKVEFLYLKPAEYKPLVKDGTAEVNTSMVEGNAHAVRITQKGLDFLAQFNENPGAIAASDKAVEMTKPVFVIKSAPIPSIKRAGGAGRPSKYPFEQLEVGQMFFVPVTEKQPDPAKSLGSVVTSANRRYATETGEMKTNRKGESVPKLEYSRRFIVRPTSETIDGEIVFGAGVWREK